MKKLNEANTPLNAATHANHIGYSDVTPFEIVRVISDQTIEIREMGATLLNKPEFVAGGYAGVCTNNYDLEYGFEPQPQRAVYRARLRKDGYFYSPVGRHLLEDQPRKYYDYNF